MSLDIVDIVAYFLTAHRCAVRLWCGRLRAQRLRRCARNLPHCRGCV